MIPTPRPRRIEVYAIVSEDGMLANAAGIMPDSLKSEADQLFFERRLDGVDVVVHGRHSHERQPRSYLRRRLVLTRRVPAIAVHPSNEKALFWNPAGASFELALAVLGPTGSCWSRLSCRSRPSTRCRRTSRTRLWRSASKWKSSAPRRPWPTIRKSPTSMARRAPRCSISTRRSEPGDSTIREKAPNLAVRPTETTTAVFMWAQWFLNDCAAAFWVRFQSNEGVALCTPQAAQPGPQASPSLRSTQRSRLVASQPISSKAANTPSILLNYVAPSRQPRRY